MSYDHWKTTEPEPSEEWAACDCCGRDKPFRQMHTVWAYGIETWACDECLGQDEEEDDGPPLTPEELIERTRETLAPCSDYSRSRGCTCSMESVPHWADEPPEPVINRSCPLHGSPVDPDDAYHDRRSL